MNQIKPNEKPSGFELAIELQDYLDQCSIARFVEIYNWVYKTNYTCEEVEWNE